MLKIKFLIWKKWKINTSVVKLFLIWIISFYNLHYTNISKKNFLNLMHRKSHFWRLIHDPQPSKVLRYLVRDLIQYLKYN